MFTITGPQSSFSRVRLAVLAVLLIIAMFACESDSSTEKNDKAGQTLILTGDKVRMRQSPSRSGEVVGELARNQQVTLLSKSSQETMMDDETHPWFKVKTAEGASGWVYSKFLQPIASNTEDSPENEETANSEDSTEDEEAVRTASRDSNLEHMLIKASPKQYDSKNELLQTASNKRYDFEYRTFSEEESELLAEKGFFLKRLAEKDLPIIKHDDMVDLYLQHASVSKPEQVVELTELEAAPEYAMVPLFISADYLLHIYHLIFVRMVEDIETKRFYPLIKKLTKTMLKSATRKYRSADEATLQKTWKRIAAFFAVPGMLMDIPVNDTNIKGLARKDFEKIRTAAGFAPSAISGKKEDFTQYKARGHYTKNETLKKYFKVMMWYGRIYFPVKSPLEGLLITSLLQNPANLEKWENIYKPTSYLVGESDDLGVYEYRRALEKFFPDSDTISEEPDEDELAEISSWLKKQKQSKIISGSVRTGEGNTIDKEEKHAGFRFMGQRFIPDSHIMTMLTSPRVGSDAKPRNMTSGLDVMAVFGSREAHQELAETRQNIPGFSDNYKSLRQHYSSIDRGVKDSTIYWAWLTSFQNLFDNTTKNLQPWMKSKAWQYRLLLAAHGSWAELRHDTILYAKQSYAEMGGPPPNTVYYAGQPAVPKGYVEPNLGFFRQLKRTVSLTRDKMRKAKVLTDQYRQKLVIFSRILNRLSSIASQQQSGERISDEDYRYIATCSRKLGDIILPDEFNQGGQIRTDTSRLNMALIADVHTDASAGKVLEVGVGIPSAVYMRVRDVNGARRCLGYVYSYYEFQQPMRDRLTDEQWKKQVYNSNADLRDKEAAWIKNIPFAE